MKGIFYSAIAIAFITPLLLFVFSDLNYNQVNSEVYTTKIIGDKLASFTKSVDNDLPRALVIISKHSLTDAIVYVETSGYPLEDVKLNLTNLIVNGTTNGSLSPSDFTLKSWTERLREKGQQFGFGTDVQVLDVQIYQLDGYTMGMDIKIAVNATFSPKNMELYRVYNSKTNLSINGFNDPLYSLNTNGVLKRGVQQPSFGVSGASAFDNAVSGGYYMPSENGPGFLDRLEGRLVSSGKYNVSSDPVGIESVVFVPDLEGIGFDVKEDQSDIDYLYFDTSAHTGTKVNGSAYNWLRIDNEHKTIYNLT